MCGTDGETYNSICELRANSANARVDHHGACASAGSNELVDNRCSRVRDSGMCVNVSNCDTAVLPQDGCCPVCGMCWDHWGI